MSSTSDKLSSLKEKLRLLESNVCIAEIKSNAIQKTRNSKINEKLKLIKESQENILTFSIRGQYNVSFTKEFLLSTLDNILITYTQNNTLTSNPNQIYTLDFDSEIFSHLIKILVYFQDKPQDKSSKYPLKIISNNSNNRYEIDLDLFKMEFESLFNGNKFDDFVLADFK